MAPRHLINEDGKPFEDRELEALGKELDALKPTDRRNFRDANARAVARHSANRMLIVAGPGTGKSTLFKERILFWLGQDASAKILAAQKAPTRFFAGAGGDLNHPRGSDFICLALI
jgi:predicted NACHT family NTPase